MKSKRLVLTFDERSFETLEQIRQEGRYSSFADAVRDALSISRALQRQAKEGYTQLRVMNPKSGAEREIVTMPLAKEQ